MIKIEGSSTVYPITKQSAQQYALAERGRTQVVIGITGTGGGFRKFCRGRTDISNASRPIKTSEIELCKANGIKFLELPIALDAITV
ncbi:substrate-binding domain-containing protein, partial [Vibrio sp. M260118]|uniref:substrate-binding domain-containing protein n=1 Tax=Vibrio sp. M260118 TaxID=3020896 RepID=UPI002F411803